MDQFRILMAWMKRWGVVSPEEQRRFLESEDVNALSELDEWHVYTAINGDRDPEKILVAAEELSQKASRSEAPEMGENFDHAKVFKGCLIVLCLLLPPVGLLVACFWVKNAIQRRSFRRPPESPETKHDFVSSYRRRSTISPTTRPSPWVSRFDRSDTTTIHPQERYSLLRDSERCCAICNESPPVVWLTVVDASRKLDTNIPVPDGHVVHQDYRRRLLHPYEARIICTGCWSQV